MGVELRLPTGERQHTKFCRLPGTPKHVPKSLALQSAHPIKILIVE
jgi:hypothetical protein